MSFYSLKIKVTNKRFPLNLSSPDLNLIENLRQNVKMKFYETRKQQNIPKEANITNMLEKESEAKKKISNIATCLWDINTEFTSVKFCLKNCSSNVLHWCGGVTTHTYTHAHTHTHTHTHTHIYIYIYIYICWP